MYLKPLYLAKKTVDFEFEIGFWSMSGAIRVTEVSGKPRKLGT